MANATHRRAAHRRSSGGARVGVHVRPLAPPVDCCQRLLDGSFYVAVLPPLVPLVRQIARADRSLNRFCTCAVRKSIDRVSKIDSRSIAAVAAILSEHVNALKVLRPDRFYLGALPP